MMLKIYRTYRSQSHGKRKFSGNQHSRKRMVKEIAENIIKTVVDEI